MPNKVREKLMICKSRLLGCDAREPVVFRAWASDSSVCFFEEDEEEDEDGGGADVALFGDSEPVASSDGASSVSLGVSPSSSSPSVLVVSIARGKKKKKKERKKGKEKKKKKKRHQRWIQIEMRKILNKKRKKTLEGLHDCIC